MLDPINKKFSTESLRKDDVEKDLSNAKVNAIIKRAIGRLKEIARKGIDKYE